MLHGTLSCINKAGWLIAVLKLGTTCFFNISLYTVALILLCSLKHHHTSSSKFNAAFSVLRQISFLRTASNEPSPNITEQVKLWLITEMNTIPQFLSPYDVFSGEFQLAHFVLFRNVRLCRSYLTVQIYFIKSSGNSVPWYFNANVCISSFRDSGCCCKSILFLIACQTIYLPLQ